MYTYLKSSQVSTMSVSFVQFRTSIHQLSLVGVHKNLITFYRKYGDTVTYEDMHGIKKRKKKRARKTVDGLPDSVTVD